MLKHASIAGQPGDGKYAQTFITGNFYGVVELAGDPAKVSLELGRNVVSKIEEIISQKPEISPNDIVQIVKQDVGGDIKISILVAFVLGQKLILATSGDVFAKVFRRGNIINLSLANVSGNLLEDDLLILGTESLLKGINLQDINSMPDKSPDIVRDSVLPKIEQQGQDQSVAGLILKLDIQPEKIEPEAQQVAPPPDWGKKSKGSAFFQSLTRFIPTKQNISYIKEAREKGFESAPQRKTLYLVVVAFVILLSGIAFQLRSRSLEMQNQNITNIEKSANDGIEASGKLIGLNDQLARESLTQKRQEIVSEIEKNFGTDWKNLKSKEGDKLRSIVGKLDKEIARAANINKISKLTDFYDFSLLKAKPVITSAQLHEGLMVTLDSENGSVYSLKTENKSGTIVGGGDFKQNNFIDFAGDNLFVYTPTGVRRKDLTTNGSFKTVTKNATSSGKIAAFASFGGNLYLLDPDNNQIWKYQGTEEGNFLPAVPYIQPGLNLDLSDSKGIVIDGFAYVFNSERILKFSSGAPESFELKSLASPIGSIDSLFASEEAKNIYIWDATNNRIVFVDKEGLYQAQYQLPTVKNGEKAIVLADEKLKKILLVSGDKVYGINF